MTGVAPRTATEPRAASSEELRLWWTRSWLMFGFAPALLASPYLLTGLDERFMGRLYVLKAPKKRSDCFPKSKIIARAVCGSLFPSKKLVTVASRRILSVCPPSIYGFSLLRRPRLTLLSSLTCEDLCCKFNPNWLPGLTALQMAPKDSRVSTETNGNIHPAGKGKAAATISRTMNSWDRKAYFARSWLDWMDRYSDFPSISGKYWKSDDESPLSNKKLDVEDFMPYLYLLHLPLTATSESYFFPYLPSCCIKITMPAH